MKIAVTTSSDKGLEAKVDLRFGRAPYFTVVDIEDMKVEVIKNSAGNAASGAGVSAAQKMSDEGIDGIISGNFGPKAFETLKNGDLKLYSFSGTVKEAVDELKKGNLEELSNPTNAPHSGLN